MNQDLLLFRAIMYFESLFTWVSKWRACGRMQCWWKSFYVNALAIRPKQSTNSANPNGSKHKTVRCVYLFRACQRSFSETRSTSVWSGFPITVTLPSLRAAPRKYQLKLQIAKKSNFFKLAQNEALRVLITKISF